MWLGDAWGAANQLGNPAAGEHYLASVAAIVNGVVKRSEKHSPIVVGADRHAPDAQDLLKNSDQWKDAISQLITETRQSE